MIPLALSTRQKKIAEIVKEHGPITGEHIAAQLKVTRAALRSDLAILVMSGILDARPKVGYFYTGKNTLGMLMEEINSIKVADLQSDPVTVENTKSAYDAVVDLFVDDVGSITVVDKEGALVGVVSRKDLLKAAMNNTGDLKDLPIVMVMTPVSKVITTTPDENAADAAHKLIENEVDSLPVVEPLPKGKGMGVVGRITKTNFTRLLVELASGSDGKENQ